MYIAKDEVHLNGLAHTQRPFNTRNFVWLVSNHSILAGR